MTFPHLLVLDFDGVICNGLREYFQSSKRVYQQIWAGQTSAELDRQEANFSRLRPAIETGWEMPLLLRALMVGITPVQIEKNWSAVSQTLQTQENIDKSQLAPTLDQVRDDYIKNELNNWLGLHDFYPRVLGQLSHWLKTGSPEWIYIVTTKEGRFVQQLLKAQKVNFPLGQIIGKEIKQPKFKTLEQLLQKHQLPSSHLWFVEDMLTTLQSVAIQPQLKEAKLFLADWGYNTTITRELVKNQRHFHLLSLAQFSASFEQWHSQFN